MKTFNFVKKINNTRLLFSAATVNIRTTSESSGYSWVTPAVVIGVLGALTISLLLTLYFCRRKIPGLCKTRTKGNLMI